MWQKSPSQGAHAHSDDDVGHAHSDDVAASALYCAQYRGGVSPSVWELFEWAVLDSKHPGRSLASSPPAHTVDGCIQTRGRLCHPFELPPMEKALPYSVRSWHVSNTHLLRAWSGPYTFTQGFLCPDRAETLADTIMKGQSWRDRNPYRFFLSFSRQRNSSSEMNPSRRRLQN